MIRYLDNPFPTLFLVLAATPAHAQQLPGWVVGGALSPVAALFLITVLGWRSRSWITGALHAGLIALWIGLFWVASVYVTNDYIIWTPLVAYALHLLVLIWLVLKVALGKR